MARRKAELIFEQHGKLSSDMTVLVKAVAPSCRLTLCTKKCNRTQGLLYGKRSTKKHCYIVALHHIFSKVPCHTNYCASSVNPCISLLTAKPIMTKKTQRKKIYKSASSSSYSAGRIRKSAERSAEAFSTGRQVPSILFC